MGFTLTKKRIILYGYTSELGKTERIVKHLHQAGFKIHRIIDQKQYPEIGDSPFCSYELFKEKEMDGHEKSDYVFILNFWDATQHVVVAKQLYEDGFCNVLFLPFDNGFELTKVRRIRRFYNHLLYGGALTDVIPTYKELINQNNRLIIGDYDEYTSFWESIHLLHVKKMESMKNISDEYPVSQFGDVPILEFTYYRELLDYIYNDGAEPQGYIANIIKDRDSELFLKNRIDLFKEMEDRLKYDWNYFVESPILVERRDEMTYTVIDGLHRAFFLWWHGFERVPVVCEKGDDVFRPRM